MIARRGNYLLIASMDVEAGKEELLNEVYDTEHVPAILRVPGVVGVTRVENTALTLSVGGAIQTIPNDGEPRFTAIYEIESPEVLTSAEWARAVETGRWPAEVRPFTLNRRLTLHKVL